MSIDALNTTFNEELVNVASELTASYTIQDTILFLILASLTAIFSLLIYSEISKIYELIEYEGIKYFKRAFLFYGIFNVSLAAISIGLIMAKLSVTMAIYVIFIILIPCFLLIAFSLWFAKASLLSTITWKMVEGRIQKKMHRHLFFIGLMFLVLVDGIIYITLSSIAGTYPALAYKAMVFILILVVIKANMREKESTRSAIRHPYYLGLILIFTLDFLGNFSSIAGNGSEIVSSSISILTLVAYYVIYKGIKKWSHILLQ